MPESMPIRVCWRGQTIGYASNYAEADFMMDEYRELVVEPFRWRPYSLEVKVRLPGWVARWLLRRGWIKES